MSDLFSALEPAFHLRSRWDRWIYFHWATLEETIGMASDVGKLLKVLVSQITASNGLPVKAAKTMCILGDISFCRLSPGLSRDINLAESDDGTVRIISIKINELISKKS